MMKVNRRTVDRSGYPNLVVIYLGMRERPDGVQDAIRFRAKDCSFRGGSTGRAFAT